MEEELAKASLESDADQIQGRLLSCSLVASKSANPSLRYQKEAGERICKICAHVLVGKQSASQRAAKGKAQPASRKRKPSEGTDDGIEADGTQELVPQKIKGPKFGGVKAGAAAGKSPSIWSRSLQESTQE